MASSTLIKSGLNSGCSGSRAGVNRKDVAGRFSSRRHYSASRYDRQCQPSQIYKHQALYPRLLRLRSIPETQLYFQTPDVFARIRVTRASSSWRDPTDRSRRREWADAEEEYNRLKQDFKTNKATCRKEWDENKQGVRELWLKWVEEDPYRALFGASESRGLMNPWAAFYKWREDMLHRNQSDAPTPRPTSSPGKDSFRTAYPADAENVEQRSTPQKAGTTREDFVIDPITMKKVPKPSLEPQVISTTKPVQDAKCHTKEGNIASPIKEIRLTTKKTIESLLAKLEERNHGLASNEAKVKNLKPPSVPLAGFALQPWLIRERFMTTAKPTEPVKRSAKAPSIGTPAAQRPKIEPSLDRINRPPAPRRSNLEYTARENKTEDIDLLRVSDVKAASGHLRKPPTISTERANRCRNELESEFTKAQHEYSAEIKSVLPIRSGLGKSRLEVKNATEASAASNSRTKSECEKFTGPSSTANEVASTDKATSEVSDKDKAFQDLYNTLKQHLESSTDLLKAAKEKILDLRLANEVNSYRSAFETFENQKKHFPAISSPTLLPNNTWKEKIRKQSAMQRARDADLIREIRSIYEDRYGAINAEHKQKAPEIDATSLETNETSSSQNQNTLQPVSSSAEQEQEAILLTATPIVELPLDLQPTKTISQPEQQPSRTPAGDTLCTPGLSNPNAKQDISAAASPTKGISSKASGVYDIMEIDEAEAVPYAYTILAMDRVNQEVTKAKTTSSMHRQSSLPRSASDILTHLDQPYRYFKFMESLESEGYQLVAGARNRLVYRKRAELQPWAVGVIPSGTNFQQAPKVSRAADSTAGSSEKLDEIEELANSLKPWREESVFAGKATPKERFVRAYERAKNSRSAAEESVAAQDKLVEALHAQKSSKQHLKRGRAGSTIAKLFGDFFRSLGVISGIIVLLYAIGRYQDGSTNERMRQREAELEKEKRRAMRDSSWLTK